MGKAFKRFKKLFLVDAIVKSVLACVAVSLLVIATFLLVIDGASLNFEVTYVVIIGLASGLLLGTVTFLVFHLSDKRLAKKLDKLFGLNEKVQTMYAFKNDKGDVCELQRAQTLLILEDCKLKMRKLLVGWLAFTLAVALAAALFACAIIFDTDEPLPDTAPSVDAEEPSGGGDEDEGEPFEPTEHHRLALLELIQYVKDSQLVDGAKEDVVDELELLVSKLDSFGTEGSMKKYVVDVIARVRTIVNDVNTTYAFNQAAKQSSNKYVLRLTQALFSLKADNVKSALRSLNESLASDYKAYKDYSDKKKFALKEIDTVISLLEPRAEGDETLFELCADLENVKELLNSIAENEKADSMNDKISAVVDEISSLIDSGAIARDDELYDPLSSLDRTLDVLVESTCYNEIGAFVDELTTVLEGSCLDKESDMYVILAELCSSLDDLRPHKIGEGRAKDKIETAVITYALEGLKYIVPVEEINEAVKDEVVSRLESIFGLKAEEEESRGYSEETETVDPDEDNKEVGDDGGFGTGDMIFGSNDLVIDPEADPGNNIDSIKVPYGEIIDRYNAKIIEMIKNGEISEEMAQILLEYFEVLMTPQKK